MLVEHAFKYTIIVLQYCFSTGNRRYQVHQTGFRNMKHVNDYFKKGSRQLQTVRKLVIFLWLYGNQQVTAEPGILLLDSIFSHSYPEYSMFIVLTSLQCEATSLPKCSRTSGRHDQPSAAAPEQSIAEQHSTDIGLLCCVGVTLTYANTFSLTDLLQDNGKPLLSPCEFAFGHW